MSLNHQYLGFQETWILLQMLELPSNTLADAILNIHRHQHKLSTDRARFSKYSGSYCSIKDPELNSLPSSVPSFSHLNTRPSHPHRNTNKFQSNNTNHSHNNQSIIKSRFTTDLDKSILYKQHNSPSKVYTEVSEVKRLSLHQNNPKNKRSILRQSSFGTSSKSSLHTPIVTSRLHREGQKTIEKKRREDQQRSIPVDESSFSEQNMKSMYLESFKCKIEDEIKNINKALKKLGQRSNLPSQEKRVVRVDISPSKGSLTAREARTPRVKESRIRDSEISCQQGVIKGRSLQKSLVSRFNRNLLEKSEDSKLSQPKVKKRELLTTRIAKYK